MLIVLCIIQWVLLQRCLYQSTTNTVESLYNRQQWDQQTCHGGVLCWGGHLVSKWDNKSVPCSEVSFIQRGPYKGFHCICIQLQNIGNDTDEDMNVLVANRCVQTIIITF